MKINILVPAIISSVMLILAILDIFPYGYYILLRWVVCGTFIWLGFQAYKQGKENWFVWILGITAAVYNPFIMMRFGRGIWTFLNIITIGIAIIAVLRLRKHIPKQ